MLSIAIIIGSTRPGRVGEGVAQWVYQVAQKRTDARFQLVDIKAFDLPLLDEPVSAATSQNYTKLHTKRWSQAIASFDAFVFVTPEYNHGIGGALKNAIDFLYYEWNNKSAGFVSYGSASGFRAAEQLRLVMGEIKVIAVRPQVALSLYTDFENFQIFKPTTRHEHSLNRVIDEVISWGEVMKILRSQTQSRVA